MSTTLIPNPVHTELEAIPTLPQPTTYKTVVRPLSEPEVEELRKVVDPEPVLSPGQKLLKKALEVFDKHGWCRGKLQNDCGQVCAVGALDIAAIGMTDSYHRSHRSGPDYTEALSRLTVQIRKRGSTSYGGTDGVIHYNDNRNRGKQEVLSLFREALEA